MAFNGSGVWVRLYNWTNDAANGIKIRADRMDAEFNDYALNGFGLCLTRDGQGQPTANLPMAGFKHTGVASGTARTHYASIGQLQDNAIMFAAAGGTADALTATFSPNTASLVDGEQHYVRAASANATTTPTYAPDGLTAHTITKFGGTALIAGDIQSGHELILRYRLSATRWELLNPFPNYIEGTWTPVDSSGGGLTFTVTKATYARIGRVVHYVLKMTFPATADTNVLTIGGLPVAAAANSSGLSPYLSDSGSAATYPLADVLAGTTTIQLLNLAGSLGMTNANMSGKILVICGTYFVS